MIGKKISIDMKKPKINSGAVIFYEWSSVIVWRERTIAYLYIVYVWRTNLIYRRNTFISMKNAKICL